MQANTDVKELVGRGDLAGAIQELGNLVEGRSGNSSGDSILMISARFQNLERQVQKGVISQENYALERNKIAIIILQVYDDLENQNKEYDTPDPKTSGVRLWSVEGDFITGFGYPRMEFNSVAFHPDGRSILTSSQPSISNSNYGEPRVSLWSTEGKLLRNFALEYDPVVSGTPIALSPDGNTVMAAQYGKRLIQWSASGEKLMEHTFESDRVRDVVFSPDSRTYLTCDEASVAKLWSDGIEQKSFTPNNNLARIGPFGKLAGQPFINIFPERARLLSLEVRSGDQVDQLKLSYRLGKEEQEFVQGGGGGKAWPKFWINSPITKITGRAGDQLDQLQVHFEDGTSTPVYGGEGGQPFSVSFAEYELAGFFGQAGNVVCQLGFFGKASAQRSY